MNYISQLTEGIKSLIPFNVFIPNVTQKLEFGLRQSPAVESL